MATIRKADGAKFVNAAAAIMALQMMQGYFALAGYLTTSRIDAETNIAELTIHYSGKDFPRLPQGYKFSEKEITSHEFWSDHTKRVQRVRCMVFYFNF